LQAQGFYRWAFPLAYWTRWFPDYSVARLIHVPLISPLQVLEITRMILALYDLWKDGYEEQKEIYAILEKMPKPKTNPTR